MAGNLLAPVVVAKAALGFLLFQSLFCCTDCDGILYLHNGIPGDAVIVTKTASLNGSYCLGDNQTTSITNIYQDGTGSVYNMQDNADYQGQSPLTGSYGVGSIPSCSNGVMYMQGGNGRLSPSLARDLGATPASMPDGPEQGAYMTASTEVQYVSGVPVSIIESGGSVQWSGFGTGFSAAVKSLSIPYTDFDYFDPPTATLIFLVSTDGGNTFVELQSISNASNIPSGTVSTSIPEGTDLSKIVVWVTLDTNDDGNSGQLFAQVNIGPIEMN